MSRKLLCLLFAVCLVSSLPNAVAANAKKTITLYVNNERLEGIIPVQKSGATYVSFRGIFKEFGYQVKYFESLKQIVAKKGDSEIILYLEENLILANGQYDQIAEPIFITNGQVYFPIRHIGLLLGYSVVFDKLTLDIRLIPFGYGQTADVLALVTKYYHTLSPRLFTSDNYQLHYYNLEFDYEANQRVSEMPVRAFDVRIDRIKYTSANEAELHVTYTENTQVLNERIEYEYKIRKERGQWLISSLKPMSMLMELPEDIDETADQIKERNEREQQAVLTDLRTYYKSYNEENYEITLQYTSPFFIKEWNGNMTNTDSMAWENMLIAFFGFTDRKYTLSEERVVFLGREQAIVLGKLDWSDTEDEVAKGDYPYEALIYLDYANGHWNYHDELDIDQDYDESK